MPTDTDKMTELTDQICRSMSRVLRSENPVLRPAIYGISRQDSEKLTDDDVAKIMSKVQDKLTSEGHTVDVCYSKTPNSPHYGYQLFSAPFTEPLAETNVVSLITRRHERLAADISRVALRSIAFTPNPTELIDEDTWLQDPRLQNEEFLTVRTTAANVLAQFRIHPVNRTVGHHHAKVELILRLLAEEGLQQTTFIHRSKQLIAALLGRDVYVLQTSDAAAISLVYTTTFPYPHPA